MGRAPCCDKANVKKGPWSPEEDAKLKAYIEQFGTGGNWIALPQKIGLKRCGKSCRLRWLNYLRPNIKHGGFSEEEDNIICSLYISIGSRWSIIAAQLPGRTDNDIKNYWNTRLKKKLLGRRKQSHINRLSGSSQDSKDANSVENLSSSAIERLQLHMQLQSLQNPFSFYTNPALWPKLNPLQEKMIQQSLQLVNDSSNPNPNNPLMQNVSPSPQLGEGQKTELYQSSNQDYSTLEDELGNSINGMPSSANTIDQLKTGISIMGVSVIQKSDAGKQSNNMEFQGVPTFQGELDDFLMNNNQMGEFDCFKEMDGSKDNAIWWSSDFETNSASSNSWDSTSVLHHQQSQVGCQDFVQGYSMH